MWLRCWGFWPCWAAAEIGLVWWTLRAPVETDEYLGPFGPEDLLEQSHIALVCAVCFLLLCAALARNGCNRGGVRLDYTLGRLSVGEKTQTAWWSVCNIACLLIFWAFQAALAWGLCGWCAAQLEAAAANEQAVFLAFYRSRFLHSLLPLAEVSRYVRNGSWRCAWESARPALPAGRDGAKRARPWWCWPC